MDVKKDVEVWRVMKVFKKVLAVLAVGIILLQKKTALAGSWLLEFPSMGVSNIRIPEKYAVITRDEEINTGRLIEEYDADFTSMKEAMKQSNVYAIAMSYDLDCEIDIEFIEGNFTYDFSGLKGKTSKEIAKEIGLNTNLDNSEVRYEEAGDNPVIVLEGYCADVNQYCVRYSCTSMSGNKYFMEMFTLYTYGIEPTEAMKEDLRNIVSNCSITAPSAEQRMANGASKGAAYGGIFGAIAGIVWYVFGKKNIKKQSNQ